MIRRPPRATLDRSSAASDVYKRTIQTNISGNLAAKDGTITFESDDTDSLSGRISVQKGCQISELTGEECNLMKLNGFELLELFGEFAGFGF